jgi:hypothetical protein
MFKNTSKNAVLGSAIAILATTVLAPIAVQAGNSWAGPERSGSCYIPNRQTSFNCQFGLYRLVTGAKQIGGFYVNPKHQSGKNGTIPIQYRINGGQWISKRLTLNSTSANYIDFGNGVRSFDFRFQRPESDELGGGSTINFKMNFDLDR